VKEAKEEDLHLLSQEDLQADIHEAELIRFCKKCNAYKAPRTHHCSECQRCVLKMDHHCPWVNNCVGHRNHKPFVLFLVYLILESCHMIFLYGWRLIVLINEVEKHKKMSITPAEGILMGIALLFIIPTLLGVCCLFCYQMQLISENTTSIESFSKESAQKKAKKKGKPYRFPFDKGFIGNFQEVFGSKPLYFLVPTAPDTDGLRFQTFKHVDA